jgi:HEAT repeat protein/predicted phosphodiesterase
MAAHQADLILHSGDFVGDGRNEEEWDPQFFNPAAALLRTAALYPAIGNHEEDDRSYYDAFEVLENGSAERSEAWYAIDYGPVHLTVLDTNPESGLFEPGSEQLSWLQQDLASATAHWKLVMFHHPLYSSARHKSNLDLRKKLMPLFVQYDVDLLISGHDHCYERTWPLEGDKRAEGGIVHFVSGGGGATLYPVGRDTWTAVSASAHHYCILDVKGDRLDLDVFDLNDREVDAFTLVKESAAKRLAKTLDSATDLAAHIQLLGRTADRRNVEGIRAHAGSTDLTIRRAVAEALSRISSRESIPALAALSGDDDTEVRRWATRGLAYVDGRASSTHLIARLSDADPETRRFAAIGLGLIPVKSALPALVRAAEDTETTVRLAVVEALSFYHADPARKAIVGRLTDDSDEVRHMAVSVVVDSKLEKLAAQALVTLLPRETEEEKIRILQLLGSAGEPASVDAMQVELSGGTTRVRRRAAIELGQLRSDRAVGGLIEALSDKDRGVRQFAWRALRVITGERHPKDDQTAWRIWHEGR